jgi:hypothetical protein
VAAGEEGVMFIEISGSPVGVGLFCVLQQELALEAGQIVHEYNYYPGLAIGCVCEVVVGCMFRYVISCYLGVL